jgi:hypothetical protein
MPKAERKDAKFCSASCRTLEWKARSDGAVLAASFGKRWAGRILKARRQRTVRFRSQQQQGPAELGVVEKW